MPRNQRTERGASASGLTPGAWLAPAWVQRAWTLVATLLLFGCGGGGTQPPVGGATQLVKDAGDQQTWYFDNPLPTAYRVIARDANGQAVPGASVTWAVTSGSGSVDASLTVTDSDGAASARHTLGLTGASQTVSASATGLTPVEFAATATNAPMSGAVSVEASSFVPRDVVVRVSGTVTWTWNPLDIDHNVVYTAGPTPRPPNSPTQSAGTHANTYSVVARYEYVCTIHAGMEGSVTVVR